MSDNREEAALHARFLDQLGELSGEASIQARFANRLVGTLRDVSRHHPSEVSQRYWLPDLQLLNAVIRGAHHAGWYVKKIGRSGDRFDLLLAPVGRSAERH